MLRVRKPWRWNCINFANARINVFVAHCEVIWCATTFKLLMTKRLEFINIIGSHSGVIHANYSKTVSVTLFCGRFVASNVILWVLDLAGVW